MKRIAVLLATLLVAAGLGAADGVAADHTPLQRAVMRQQADTVDALLEQGASVGAENHRKRTALHYAVMRGQTGTDYSLRIVSALLAHGADPNHTDDMNLTPMDLAMSRGTHAVIRALLANGADPNRTDRNGNSFYCQRCCTGAWTLPTVLGSTVLAMACRLERSRYCHISRKRWSFPRESGRGTS